MRAFSTSMPSTRIKSIPSSLQIVRISHVAADRPFSAISFNPEVLLNSSLASLDFLFVAAGANMGGVAAFMAVLEPHIHKLYRTEEILAKMAPALLDGFAAAIEEKFKSIPKATVDLTSYELGRLGFKRMAKLFGRKGAESESGVFHLDPINLDIAALLKSLNVETALIIPVKGKVVFGDEPSKTTTTQPPTTTTTQPPTTTTTTTVGNTNNNDAI